MIVGSISGYLIYSRVQQTEQAALSNSGNRAATMRQVLERFVGTQGLDEVSGIAKQEAVRSALQSATPQKSLSTLIQASPSDTSSGLVLTDAAGVVVYSYDGRRTAPLSAALAMRGIGQCVVTRIDPVAGGVACGLDTPSDQPASYDVSVPIRSAAGLVIGSASYVAPLSQQLTRFAALFGFPTAYIASGAPGSMQRAGAATGVPPAIRTSLRNGAATATAIYDAPTASGVQSVAGSFVTITGPDGAIAGYLGVEAPTSAFVGDAGTDALTVMAIALFLILLTALGVYWFVARFVTNPISELDRGVTRIAGGDYGFEVTVRGRDELGRLAKNINNMRGRISSAVTALEMVRQRTDRGVEQMSVISRTLTTTTTGVVSLRDAVLESTAQIVGNDPRVVLMQREGDKFFPVAVRGRGPVAAPDGRSAPRLIAGEVDVAPIGRNLSIRIPMFHQENVVGALCILVAGENYAAAENELDLLRVLANNAAIALENARLYEQEHTTAERLRELDAMKSDFLATVQHELRTPMTVMIGFSDLAEMYWDHWDDQQRLDSIHDIQVAAANMHNLVETIIDFTLLEDDVIGLKPVMINVKESLTEAVRQAMETDRYSKTVPVVLEGPEDAEVFADKERFEQTFRALVDNAIKFTESGENIKVAWRKDPRRKCVHISVTDRGVGIDAEHLPHIFERFFQVDNSATRRFGGIGMGLALVDRLLTAHGARAEVESHKGRGTTISIRWPAIAQMAKGEARQIAENHGELHATGVKVRGARVQ